MTAPIPGGKRISRADVPRGYQLKGPCVWCGNDWLDPLYVQRLLCPDCREDKRAPEPPEQLELVPEGGA